MVTPAAITDTYIRGVVNITGDFATSLLPTSAEPPPTGSCPEHWESAQHVLYQLANVCFLVANLATNTIHGILFLHCALVAGFLLFTVWTVAITCAPDAFGWSLCLTAINIIQAAYITYTLRPVRVSKELEGLYSHLFKPLEVPLSVYTSLVQMPNVEVLDLPTGHRYAVEGETTCDRLSLLISGRLEVKAKGEFLHEINQFQFIDSATWESYKPGSNDKYQVTITAVVNCRYIMWPRKNLEQLMAKDGYLYAIMTNMMGRDICQKLHALDEKIMHPEKPACGRMDVRLPSLSTFVATHDVRSLSSSSGVGLPRLRRMRSCDPDDDDSVFIDMPSGPNTPRAVLTPQSSLLVPEQEVIPEEDSDNLD
ncbi:popeye domain-containing protein 3-like [Ptychodera flava]|uniref:popeye domain-containing protein 3-like n=1 Tax=Ptychodera flava TaxID=63121 RepID=UPI003969E44D